MSDKSDNDQHKFLGESSNKGSDIPKSERSLKDDISRNRIGKMKRNGLKESASRIFEEQMKKIKKKHKSIFLTFLIVLLLIHIELTIVGTILFSVIIKKAGTVFIVISGYSIGLFIINIIIGVVIYYLIVSKKIREFLVMKFCRRNSGLKKLIDSDDEAF